MKREVPKRGLTLALAIWDGVKTPALNRRESLVRQLNLDRDKLDHCYELSQHIVSFADKFIDRHSTPAVESATLMLLGVEGEHRGETWARLMVEKLTKDQLRLGAAHWWGKALLGVKEEPKRLAERLARGKMGWNEIPDVPPQEIRKKVEHLATEYLKKIEEHRKNSPSFFQSPIHQPQIAVAIYEEKPKKIQAKVDDYLKQGVSFCVAPSLTEHPKTAHVVLKTKGLNVPEQIVLGLQQKWNAFLVDGWSPILQGEIDAKRSLVDHAFALSLCNRYQALILNDPIKMEMSSPQFLALLLLYEQLARREGFSFEKIMFHFSPEELEKTKGLFSQLAFAQMLRETFPQSPLWMVQKEKANHFLYWIASFAELDIVEFGDLNEKEIEFAKKCLTETTSFADEFSLNTYGKIAREAQQILDQTWKFLKQLQQLTLWKSFEEDRWFPKKEGKKVGGEMVFQKSFHYLNPVLSLCQASESY